MKTTALRSRWPWHLVLLLFVSGMAGPQSLEGQGNGCPEAEFGHPAQTLDSLVFVLALERGQEALKYAHDPQGAAVLLRPVCAASRGDFGYLDFKTLPHIMLERQGALRSEGREIASYEVHRACLAYGTAMVPPPAPDSPSREERRQRLSALASLCSPLPALIVISLPEQVAGSPDLWSVYVSGFTPSSTEAVRVTVRWEGGDHPPVVLSVEHIEGWVG